MVKTKKSSTVDDNARALAYVGADWSEVFVAIRSCDMSERQFFNWFEAAKDDRYEAGYDAGHDAGRY